MKREKKKKRVMEDRKHFIVKPFSMLASLGWTQWPFLHCFQERQLQISQQLRDKTQVCCFSVENPRAFRGTCVPLPPHPTAGSTGTCRALPAVLLALPRCWRNNLKAGPQAPAPCSWFSLHGSILLLPTICVFQHLPTHRRPWSPRVWMRNRDPAPL